MVLYVVYVPFLHYADRFVLTLINPGPVRTNVSYHDLVLRGMHSAICLARNILHRMQISPSCLIYIHPSQVCVPTRGVQSGTRPGDYHLNSSGTSRGCLRSVFRLQPPFIQPGKVSYGCTLGRYVYGNRLRRTVSLFNTRRGYIRKIISQQCKW